MDYRILDSSKEEVAGLFTSVFSASEGAAEGALIGGLASDLAARADNQEMVGVGAYDEGALVGAIYFTRLRFDEPSDVYLLAPVAVRTEYQGKGLGQALIRSGLQLLKQRDVLVVVTYGDPAFYSRMGFRALSEDQIQAPLALSMPEGWLGLSLSGGEVPILKGRPACVAEFDDPDYW